MKKIICIGILSLLSFVAFAQKADSVLQNINERMNKQKSTSLFDKKFYWWLQHTQGWSSITQDNSTNDYFYKPSMGWGAGIEYYFFKGIIGMNVGALFQQKGVGIITPDSDPNKLGDPDSTYRMRLRFEGIDIPISLVFRAPKEFSRNAKLSASINVTPFFNLKSSSKFHSVEDGFHTIVDVNDLYYKNDLAFGGSIGADINAGNACILRVHALGQWGTANVYKTNGLSGKSSLLGVKVTLLF